MKTSCDDLPNEGWWDSYWDTNIDIDILKSNVKICPYRVYEKVLIKITHRVDKSGMVEKTSYPLLKMLNKSEFGQDGNILDLRNPNLAYYNKEGCTIIKAKAFRRIFN